MLLNNYRTYTDMYMCTQKWSLSDVYACTIMYMYLDFKLHTVRLFEMQNMNNSFTDATFVQKKLYQVSCAGKLPRHFTGTLNLEGEKV